VIDREPARHLVWSCDDMVGWWHALKPEFASMFDPGDEPEHASHIWFGNDAVVGADRPDWLRRFDVSCGVAVTVEAAKPGRVAGGLALAFSKAEPRSPSLDPQALLALTQHAATLLFDAYMRMPRMPSVNSLHLTPREVECLRWAAGGKSSWETSVILDVRVRTVNFHFANVFTKLNVNNKQAAVAQAMLHGLL
jgi:DNA-binding CsgD family transcriptional regulator